jgi:hypothetical protein
MTFMIHFSVITYTDFILGHVLWLGAISFFLFLTVYGAESKKSFQGARGKWGNLKLSVGGVI